MKTIKLILGLFVTVGVFVGLIWFSNHFERRGTPHREKPAMTAEQEYITKTNMVEAALPDRLNDLIIDGSVIEAPRPIMLGSNQVNVGKVRFYNHGWMSSYVPMDKTLIVGDKVQLVFEVSTNSWNRIEYAIKLKK